MRRSFIAGGTAVVAVAGAVAFAAAGALAGGDVIHSCAKKHGGALRAIGAGKQCKKSERSLEWNQQGPAGRNGAKGAPGTPGKNGVTNITTASNHMDLTTGQGANVHVDCPTDHPIVTGGGGYWTTNEPALGASFPQGKGWTVFYRAGAATTINVYALCAAP
jgi:hypothetical protein